MRKRGLIILIAVFFIGLASAQTCSVTTSCSSSDNIIMKMSSQDNAHGAVYDDTNYNYCISCDFIGSHECDGGNKIMGLSATTNAHAESPSLNNYNTHVCFGDLTCAVGAGSCPDGYTIEIASLSSDTNAHIGSFGYYNLKICCAFSVIPYGYWQDSSDNLILNPINVIPGTTKVYAVIENSGLSPGENISIEIYEKDLLSDDSIRTGADALSGTVDSEGDIKIQWIITQEDIDKAGSESGYEFYFKFNSGRTSTNKLLVDEIISATYCSSISICKDYLAQQECVQDMCDVANYSVWNKNNSITCGDGFDCGCYWNGDSCHSYWDGINILNPPPLAIGTCTYTESTDDDCSDGILTYSWIANWVWDPENTEQEDPEGKQTICRDGSSSIMCPAEIQLYFFGYYNAISVLILLTAIYTILILKKRDD
ncbi:MAG: hypothetical protein ABH804_00795 [archaeon]